MRIHGPFARALLVLLVAGGGFLAVVGGLALRGPGLIAVGLAGVLAGLTAAGVARETPGSDVRTTLETAVLAAGGAATAVLTVAGLSALAGGAAAALVVGLAVTGWFVHRLARRRGTAGDRRRAEAPVAWQPGVDVLLLPVPPDAEPFPNRAEGVPGAPRLLPPVAELGTPALGAEWLRTTAVLAGPLEPAERQSIVARRQDALDELERRDPVGFSRWMAGGPAPGSDPAEFVQDGPATGSAAA